MQAYDDAVNDACMPTCQLEGLDAVGAARAAFEALVATLAGAQAAGWTHDQVEEHLDIDGRELLRLLYQAIWTCVPCASSTPSPRAVSPRSSMPTGSSTTRWSRATFAT